MQITSLRRLYFMLETQASNRLSRLIDGIIEGSDEVLTTPIVKDVSPDEVLKGWDDIFQNNIGKMNNVLVDLEDDQRSKYGPRSIAVKWKERRDGVYAYFNVSLSGYLYGKVKPIRERLLKNRGRLRPLSFTNALKYIKRNTSAGLPTMEKKGTVIADVSSFMLRLVTLLAIEWPCVMFTRTQEKLKTRTVWGYPLSVVLDEMRFYRPILEYQRQMYYRVALRTPEDTDLAMSHLIDWALITDRYLISIDFSSYDATVIPPLQLVAFCYFASLYQGSYYDEIMTQFDRFATIGLVTPDGVLSGEHGIPSGSAFTNEVGSVVQHEIAHESEEVLRFDQQQGDDGAYAVADPERFKDHFRSFGLSVNDDKSFVSKDYLVYLQNLYHVDYRDETGIIHGIYSTYRALCRLVYQERFNDFSKFDIEGRDYYGIRALSILETCSFHPLFRELVTYIHSLDKYGLKVSDQGISAYVRMREIQDGKDVRFTEYKRGDSTSIKDFESYKIVQELNVQ